MKRGSERRPSNSGSVFKYTKAGAIFVRLAYVSASSFLHRAGALAARVCCVRGSGPHPAFFLRAFLRQKGVVGFPHNLCVDLASSGSGMDNVHLAMAQCSAVAAGRQGLSLYVIKKRQRFS